MVDDNLRLQKLLADRDVEAAKREKDKQDDIANQKLIRLQELEERKLKME